MGELRFGKFSKCVKESDREVGSEAIASLESQFQLVVEPLDNAVGEFFFGFEIVQEEQLAMGLESAGHPLERFEATAGDASAPSIEELSGPSARSIVGGTAGNPIGEWRPLEIGTAKSVATSADYPIISTDRHVTVQAPGRRITLPADPHDGERHEIKAGGAFTVVIDGNGKTIDGSPSYAQSETGNARQCVSAVPLASGRL